VLTCKSTSLQGGEDKNLGCRFARTLHAALSLFFLIPTFLACVQALQDEVLQCRLEKQESNRKKRAAQQQAKQAQQQAKQAQQQAKQAQQQAKRLKMRLAKLQDEEQNIN
jgi:hypothetical protein